MWGYKQSIILVFIRTFSCFNCSKVSDFIIIDMIERISLNSINNIEKLFNALAKLLIVDSF